MSILSRDILVDDRLHNKTILLKLYINSYFYCESNGFILVFETEQNSRKNERHYLRRLSPG